MRKQRFIAFTAAAAVMALVAALAAVGLYLWPQLLIPGALFALLAMLGVGAIVFHFVNEMDGHVEAKIEAEKRSWRDGIKTALAKNQAAPLKIDNS